MRRKRRRNPTVNMRRNLGSCKAENVLRQQLCVCMSTSLFPSPSLPVTLSVIVVWWEGSYCHLVLRCSNYSVADLITVISLIYSVCTYDMKSSFSFYPGHLLCAQILFDQAQRSIKQQLHTFIKEWVYKHDLNIYLSCCYKERCIACLRWHVRAICDFFDPHYRQLMCQSGLKQHIKPPYQCCET